jgi:hypothetical protein
MWKTKLVNTETSREFGFEYDERMIIPESDSTIETLPSGYYWSLLSHPPTVIEQADRNSRYGFKKPGIVKLLCWFNL